MKLDPQQRRTMLEQMPRRDRGRTMLRLGLRLKAIGHDKHTLTAEQRRRLETDLMPVIKRIQAATASTNLRGHTAQLADQADALFNDIMGADWRPRPDNPVERECQHDLLVSLADL